MLEPILKSVKSVTPLPIVIDVQALEFMNIPLPVNVVTESGITTSVKALEPNGFPLIVVNVFGKLTI